MLPFYFVRSTQIAEIPLQTRSLDKKNPRSGANSQGDWEESIVSIKVGRAHMGRGRVRLLEGIV